jgi:hypothetical protein
MQKCRNAGMQECRNAKCRNAGCRNVRMQKAESRKPGLKAES